MVFTPEGFTYTSPILTGPSVTVKNPSALKSIRQLTEVLDFKHKTGVFRLVAAK